MFELERFVLSREDHNEDALAALKEGNRMEFGCTSQRLGGACS